jgi:Spy/CpxP family protein refolding chaperone
MKKWQVIVLVVLFVSFGTVVLAYGPSFGDEGPPFAGPPAGFRGPFAGSGGFAGPTTPFAREGFGPGFGTGFQGGFGPGQYLNLSEEQVKKMSGLRDLIYSETRDLRYDLAQKRLEMRKLVTEPKTDEATLLAKQKEISALREKLLDKMAQIPLEMRKILNPEQIQKLGMMPMGLGRMGGMMGRGMLGGPFMGSGRF